MAQFKPYLKYKDSGVEWLGEVPEHWIVKKLGTNFINRKEKVSDKDYMPLSVTKRGVVPQLDSAAKTDYGDNRKKVLVGDYVINSRSDRKGSSGVSTLDGSVSLINIVLKPLKSVVPNFSHYLFRSYLFQEEFYKYGHGIVADLWTTNYEDMRNIYLAIPNNKEQTQIANYLDKETAKIDTLIAKQEKLIELLEEQRKSIISHAVTKGLDPNAPMKNSGIEWLGEVPAHWDITYIKYITKKISSGKTPLGGAEVYTDEGIIFLRSQNIYNNGLHLDDVSFISHEIHASMKSSAVKKNDVLLNITGGSIGRTCLVDCEIGEANVNQHVCIIRASKEKYSKWISVFMKSNSAQSQIFYSQTGAGREGLNFSQIGNMRLPFPSLNEQQEILNFLEKEDLRFDNLISKQNLLIKKLKEYRASVISHAVTGKIDVRELGA